MCRLMENVVVPLARPQPSLLWVGMANISDQNTTELAGKLKCKIGLQFRSRTCFKILWTHSDQSSLTHWRQCTFCSAESVTPAISKLQMTWGIIHAGRVPGSYFCPSDNEHFVFQLYTHFSALEPRKMRTLPLRHNTQQIDVFDSCSQLKGFL